MMLFNMMFTYAIWYSKLSFNFHFSRRIKFHLFLVTRNAEESKSLYLPYQCNQNTDVCEYSGGVNERMSDNEGSCFKFEVSSTIMIS